MQPDHYRSHDFEINTWNDTSYLISKLSLAATKTEDHRRYESVETKIDKRPCKKVLQRNTFFEHVSSPTSL